MELKKKLKDIVDPLDHYVLIPTQSQDFKIKEEGESVEVLTPTKRYVFPREDVCFLPIPATTSELLAKYIYEELKKTYIHKKIVVTVGESKSNKASYEE